MRKTMNNRAFTLVETLVAVFISTIILAGIYSALIAGNRSWVYYKESISYKNEVRRAMMSMVNELREAKNVVVIKELGDIRMNFYRSGVGVVSYLWSNRGTNANRIMRVNGADVRILANQIREIDFLQSSEYVVIDIKSQEIAKKQTMTQIHLREKVAFRHKLKQFL